MSVIKVVAVRYKRLSHIGYMNVPPRYRYALREAIIHCVNYLIG